MFSWIIEQKSKILSIEWWEITVQNTLWNNLEIWQSIAHDWACMTITQFDSETYSFFTMEESFNKTNFWHKKVWDLFNIEKSLEFNGKIDGHFVTWHIDTTGTVNSILKNTDWSWEINVQFDKQFFNNIIEKWSVAINWVSLTVVNVQKDVFSVCIIPLTQELTNIWSLQKWDIVNLEFDMMWKYILKYLENTKK